MKSFLLLSDIHACNIDPVKFAAPSFVSSNNGKADPKNDPLLGLEQLISSSGLTPDYILCAGDITNKSEPSAFTYAWNRLNQIADKFNAKLISTVGNHDLDSRFKENKYDPKGYAMSLSPKIPIPERERFLEFWAENFTLIIEDDCNIIVLNTAAYHGYSSDAALELEHGRITDVTIAGISETLKRANKSNINILLCHHHPIKDQGDSDLVGQTRGGEQLVEALGNADDTWIIVHGHKHVPDLFYGHGGSNSPIILGCASFSAQVTDTLTRNPNQVHLLVCEDDPSIVDASVSSAGVVKSWNWVHGVGWKKAEGNTGLPHETGFGFRGNPKIISDQIVAYLKLKDPQRAKWEEVIGKIPQVKWLTPKDYTRLEAELTSKNVTILKDSLGEHKEVGIKT